MIRVKLKVILVTVKIGFDYSSVSVVKARKMVRFNV